MELGVSNFDKVKGLYNSVVFYMLVPRYLLFPQLFKERYLTVAIHLLCCFAGNEPVRFLVC
ncbi:hypothetical protein CF68_06085 [Cupriavidus sp. SK-4]|nr:hypothetical protein CF68_06085 [Cupriavidus sp. SK-4]